MKPYTNAHTRRWAAKIASLGGFVFVTPEYNHSLPAALKNAIDYLYAEWNNKAAAFVGYGGAGAVHAIEHLRQVTPQVKLASVRPQLALSLSEDFEGYTTLKPCARQEAAVTTMLDTLIVWASAFQTTRVALIAA